MQRRKEIIREGDFTYIDPTDGSPKVLRVTDKEIDHFFTEGKKMLDAGLSVPAALEHQNIDAMTPAEKAAHKVRNLAGYANGYEILDVTETLENGEQTTKKALFGTFDITDSEINKKIDEGTLKYVSPYIHSFVDGDGRAWDSVVSHVAITPTPRITRQTTFQDLQSALSVVGAAKAVSLTDAAKTGFVTNTAGRVAKAKDDAPWTPVEMSSFGDFSGVKLSDGPPKKDDEEEEEEEEDDAVSEEAGGGVKQDDKPPAKKRPEPTVNDILRVLLKRIGVKLPEGTDESAFLTSVTTAIMQEANKVINPPKSGDPDINLDDDSDPLTTETPAMFMSMEEIKKNVTGPRQRQVHEALLSIHTENESLKKKILGDALAARTKEVKDIAERLPKDSRDRLLKRLEMPDAKLSLVDGAVVDPVREIIDLHRDLANALANDEMSGADVIPLPKNAYNPEHGKMLAGVI